MERVYEVARRAGLSLDTLGAAALQRALGKIDGHADAWEELIEELVVPETWFFRDEEPFALLAEHARRAARPLRLLSAPCSTGEEPYSMAIALLEAGLDPEEFSIDAVDISARAIGAAERAVFARPSFRRERPDILTRHFEPAGECFRLRPEVARLVRFRRLNLLEPEDLAGPYHAIFCRNLMIYLDEQARGTLIARLAGLLAEDGILFVGHCEVMLFLDAGFHKVSHARAFACRKSTAEPEGMEEKPRARPKPRVSRPRPAEAPAKAAAGRPDLAQARRLADEGRLAEAAAVCEELLRAGHAGAEVYYLRGLIHEASNELARAREDYGKALYLDPQHCEAMVHMSLLCEAGGDLERGAIFRERARRAEAARAARQGGEA